MRVLRQLRACSWITGRPENGGEADLSLLQEDSETGGDIFRSMMVWRRQGKYKNVGPPAERYADAGAITPGSE